MTTWDAVAAAIAAAPEVEAFQAGDGRECFRSEPVDRWIAVQVAGRATVCARRGSELDCRARDEDYLGCSAWSEGPSVAPPPLLGLLDTLAVAQRGSPSVVEIALGEEARLAVRTETGWHLATSGDILGRVVESFDASEVLGAPGHALVTADFDGCGNGGTTRWTLTILRERGPWLEFVATRDLGATWFAREDGPTLRDGARLRARPAGRGRVRLSVAEDYSGGKYEILDAVGIWTVP